MVALWIDYDEDEETPPWDKEVSVDGVLPLTSGLDVGEGEDDEWEEDDDLDGLMS